MKHTKKETFWTDGRDCISLIDQYSSMENIVSSWRAWDGDLSAAKFSYHLSPYISLTLEY